MAYTWKDVGDRPDKKLSQSEKEAIAAEWNRYEKEDKPVKDLEKLRTNFPSPRIASKKTLFSNARLCKPFLKISHDLFLQMSRSRKGNSILLHLLRLKKK